MAGIASAIVVAFFGMVGTVVGAIYKNRTERERNKREIANLEMFKSMARASGKV